MGLLGGRGGYSSEGNYQEAIITFTAAIEIDPKQAETYLKLSDAYEAMGSGKLRYSVKW